MMAFLYFFFDGLGEIVVNTVAGPYRVMAAATHQPGPAAQSTHQPGPVSQANK